MLKECCGTTCDKRAVEEEIRRRIIDAYAAGYLEALYKLPSPNGSIQSDTIIARTGAHIYLGENPL